MPFSRSVSGFIRSNIVGFIALFVALGGVAWAVTTAPKNSVVSKSIKNGQVKNADLAAKAVKASNLAPKSVTGASLDLSDVMGTLQIRRAAGGATPGNSTTFFQINTLWQLKGYCVNDGAGTGHAYIALSHQGGAEALLDVNKGSSWTSDRFTGGEAPTHLAQTVVTSGEASAGGQFLAQIPGFANNLAGTVSAAYDSLDFAQPTCTFLFNGGGE
jgi:hypothetical protein